MVPSILPKNEPKISALASKKGLTKERVFIFFIRPLLEARAEIFSSFLGEVKTPEFPFENFLLLVLCT